MRSFKEVAYNFEKPIADLNANSMGPGLDTMRPIINLTAGKEITKSDLDQLERYADKLFAAVGIDVEFTRHFLDRVNDERNKKQITTAELTRLFKQSFKKYGKKIAQLGPDAEAVINDMKTDVNMPFALNLKGGELELVAKTIMRKKDFKTRNPKLAFEQYRMLEAPRIPRKKGQPAGSDKHSDLYTDENPKGTIHGLKFATVEDAKASVAKIEKSGKTHAHKIQAAIAMEQRARVMGKTGPADVYRAYINKMKKKTKEMRKDEGVSEALKLKLSYPKKNPDMMVLKVRDTKQKGHVEVRGKKGYETKHNKRDELHKFLDKLDGPTVSTLLGTEDEITLNPKNPDRKQTIKVVNDLIQKN